MPKANSNPKSKVKRFRITPLGPNTLVVRHNKRVHKKTHPYHDKAYVSTNTLKLDIEHMLPFISTRELEQLQPQLLQAQNLLEKRRGPGREFLGWIDLPLKTSRKTLKEIKITAEKISKEIDVFLGCGIGGSYLGAKAALDAILHPYFNQMIKELRCGKPEIYFCGQHLDADEFRSLMDLCEGRRVGINVISKSGTTTETAVAFRFLKAFLDSTQQSARECVIATTDARKGVLRDWAKREKLKTYVIPDDVGGRFSVLTPVGLLPIAMAGIDIEEIMAGAATMAKRCKSTDWKQNPALAYAGIRYALSQRGYGIEILSTFSSNLKNLSEWWKQLFGESEGKDGKGIFPASACFTTDLHSLGQYIQDGKRQVFETFLWVEQSHNQLPLPSLKGNPDGLNYLSGKPMHWINEQAYKGTVEAHSAGKVPNMSIKVPHINPFTLGQLFYFFEYAVAIGGYLMGVNPFDQPGVETYKKAMFSYLGKPK